VANYSGEFKKLELQQQRKMPPILEFMAMIFRNLKPAALIDVNLRNNSSKIQIPGDN
jgi:hypothetical protein